MSSSETSLFDPQELRRLATLYDAKRYLFDIVSPRFAQTGTLPPYDFFAIVIWKSNRTKTKIARGLASIGKTVEALMREVSAASAPQFKIDLLLQVPGIGLAMASAILTVCYPDEFTVLDYRAWDTLRSSNVPGLPSRYPATTTEYLQYCLACKHFAQRVDLSLRDLDRALWARDWEDDLLRLTRDMHCSTCKAFIWLPPQH